MKLSKSTSIKHTLKVLALAIATQFIITNLANAHPYASALTNDAGTVSFRINEAGATAKVIGNGGTLTNDLGAVPKGLTVTNLTSFGMTGGVFRVVVDKTGGGVPALISDDSVRQYIYEQPRANVINVRPASPYFGRIYVANARVGTSAAPTNRPCGDGIYVLNADGTDALGQGDTALTGGIDMATGGTSMPWRLSVGVNDDMLYICDWADSDGNLYRTDPDVSAGSGTNVLKVMTTNTPGSNPAVAPVGSANNHGSVAMAIVTGTLGGGNMTIYTVDEDYESNPDVIIGEQNSLWRYDVGSGPLPWGNAPTKLATPSIGSVSQTMGLARATNGYLYLTDQRSSGFENVLQVINPAGPTELYRSKDDSAALGSTTDLLSNSVAVAVSADMKYLAVVRAAGQVVVMPMVNGIPSLAQRIEFAATGASSTRDIGFDAADNIYVCSNSSERLRIYTLGLTTTAVTSSDGTFSLGTPATTVSVTVDTNVVYEAGPVTAVFTVTRNNDPLTNALTVVFNASGTATRGPDYILQTNGVTFTGNAIIIPTGVASTTVSLIASNDTTAELTETATLNISGSGNYSAGSPATASVDIVDNEAPVADITVRQLTVFEQTTNDYATFRITRRGDTNAPSFSVNLNYGGTATSNVDYVAVPSVTIDPGVVNQDFQILPIDDGLLEGNETITISVAAGSGYGIGTNSPSATATIIDDEQPPATVLFSDNFDTDTSANWTIKFGSGNGIDDYSALFNYDYSALGIPPAPHSGGTNTQGVLLTVNKTDATALGGAGLNIYPNGQNFSGNYALRCDMYLMVNSGSGTTEYSMVGLNHSGNQTNWFRSSGDGIGAGRTADGVFCQMEADGAALGDYVINAPPVTFNGVAYNPTAVASRAASTLTSVFKAPPWQGTSGAGAPANEQTTATPSWAQVQLSQIGNTVTLTINNTNIMSFVNNTNAATSGNIMLGYDDAFDSNTGTGAAVIYDNLRVVDLGRPNITSIARSGTNAVMTFTWTLDEATSVFRVQRATVVTGPYADVSNASIVRVGPGSYQATAGQSGAAAFYRIRR